MTTIIPATVSFHTDIDLEQVGDLWQAYAEPTGITVQASTQQQAIDKVMEGVNFFTQTVGDRDGISAVRQYLDRHGIPNVFIKDQRAMQFRHSQPTRVEVFTVA